MQHTDKAISEFEAWWPKQLWHECFDDVKDQMRNVWLASRRELVVELPRPDTNMHNGRSDAACELLLEQWDADRAAIEAAGVTVRG